MTTEGAGSEEPGWYQPGGYQPGGYQPGGSNSPAGYPGYSPPQQAGYQGNGQPGYPAAGYPTQGYPTQGYPEQSYPQQGYPTQGYPQQDYQQPGYPAPGYQTQGYQTQGYQTQGYQAQGYPQGYPQQGAAAAPGRVGHAGAAVTIVGGVLTLLAFAALPLVSFFGFGAVTGLQIATEAGRADPSALVIWLVPLFALIIAVIGLSQVVAGRNARGNRTGGSIVVIILGVLTAGAYVVLLLSGLTSTIGDDSGVAGLSVLSFLGIGFWVALIGMLMAVVGAIVELGAPGRAARAR